MSDSDRLNFVIVVRPAPLVQPIADELDGLDAPFFIKEIDYNRYCHKTKADFRRDVKKNKKR